MNKLDTDSSEDEFYLVPADPSMASKQSLDFSDISDYEREFFAQVATEEATLPTAVRETHNAMRELHQSSDAKTLQSSMLELIDLIDNEEALSLMEDRRVHEDVLEAMKCGLSFINKEQIEKEDRCNMYWLQSFQVGCSLLCKLSNRSRKLQKSIGKSETVKLVMNTLKNHPVDMGVQISGIEMLGCVALSDHGHKLLMTPEFNITNYVTSAMGIFWDNADLQITCCRALTNLLVGVKDIENANIMKKEAELVINTLKKHKKHKGVVVETCHLMSALHKSDSLRKVFISDAVYQLVVDAMKICHFSRELDVWIAGGRFLTLLSTHQQVQQSLGKQDMHSSCLTMCISYMDHPMVQKVCFDLFSKLAPTAFEDKACTEEWQWLRQVYQVLSRHREDAQVQAAGLNTLCTLLEYRPHLQTMIGDSLDEKQEPLHTICLGAILMHGGQDPVLFTAACTAIYWMTAANDRLQRLLMEKNTYVAIYSCMRCHLKDARALEAACKAIRGFCIFNPEYKSVVYSDDISFKLLVRALNAFDQMDQELQIQAISVLACLADLEIARHQCLIAKVHRKVLKAMLLHVESEVLQECALEALAILAAAEGAVDLLNEANAMNQTLETMRNHSNSYGVQKKGLVLIQLLVSNLEPDHPAFYRVIAHAIKSAMEKNTSDESISIQSEGCVAMQLLAEKCNEAAHALVDTQAHHCLFSILERFDEYTSHIHTCRNCAGNCYYVPQPPHNSIYTGLYDLASECLYVLGWVRNLTDRLLLSASQEGLLKVVACLVELGADVNIGIGHNTPLGYACQQRNEALVQYLLEQGAVNDIQTPLKLSLERHTDDITGMLLKHMGYDKHAGIVAWSGLNLGGISPKWLYPTLLHIPPTSEKKQDIGKGLVATVRRSQKKRERRLSQEKEDMEDKRQKFGSRMRLRYLDHEKIEGSVIQIGSITQRLPDTAATLEPIVGSPPPDINVPDSLKNRRRTVMAMSEDKTRRVKVSPRLESLNMEIPYKFYQKRPSDTALLVGEQHHAASSYVYIQWPEEFEEWKRETITGCNVPFSPIDPRQIAKDSRPHSSKFPVKTSWSRKQPVASIYMIRYAGDKRKSLPSAAEELVSGHNSEDCCVKDTPTDPEKEGDEDTMLSDAASDIPDRNDKEMSEEVIYKRRRKEFQQMRTETLDCSMDVHPLEVKVFDLSSNNIPDLFILVRECGQELYMMFEFLEKLDLSHNSLKEFPEQLFKCLPNLQELDLKHNHLQQFPSQALACRKLQIIDVSNNEIVNLELPMMTTSDSMLELIMSQNKLSNFPAWVGGHLPNLKKLELDGNKIETLPDDCLELKQLEVLSLSHNYLKKIPEKFLANCLQLGTLLLINNELVALPSEDLATNFQYLTTLKLACNNLAAKEPFFIPKMIMELPSLKYLDLGHNSLVGIPSPTSWKSDIVKEILLNNNNIKVLDLGPKDDKKWSQLERLSVSHNKLREIPKTIEKFTNLTSLDFSHNDQITTLPDELGKLEKLWELPLTGLSLDLDETLVNDVTYLKCYLHERLKKSEEYFRIKVMVVGFAGRGKTTLLRSLRKVKQPEKSIATVGILVRDWVFKAEHMDKTDKKIKTVQYKLSTWDFAGQEEFYSTHQCFLSNRSLFMVVCNITKGPEEVETLKPWLLNIQARAPGCPVIIVGTHKDLLPEDEKELRIKEMTTLIRDMCSKPGFPKVKAFECVNGKRDNRDIEHLRTRIKAVIDEFKVKGRLVMGQKVPASYTKMETIIEQARGNQKGRFPVIARPELERMTSELQLDHDELNQAVRFLHESGVLLHYNDASLQLKNLFFIDPEWLCRMFAQVVTVREINPFISDGIMKKADVSQLFKGKRVGDDVIYTFPTSLIPQYLRLLEKFEIALPINENDLLIPCRLPEEKPDIAMPLLNQAQGVIHRCYEMLYYIPIGFWSRLLTRLLTFTADMVSEMPNERTIPMRKYWKEGIYVFWSEQAYFLIETLHSPREIIDIQVPSTNHGGRLLGHIVDHFDALVEEWYPGLTEKDPVGDEPLLRTVPCPSCNDGESHRFSLDELIDQAKLEENILCPNHVSRPVSLHLLAPDVMLSDLEDRFRVDHSQFRFMQSPENSLGDGSYGAVYRAEYRQQSVAVKVYNSVGDISPHKFMRQEVTILRRLQHPSLLQMLGADIKPMVLILELAPLGSLGSLLKTRRALSRGLQQRIASQVAEGLMYLHHYRIIYRDMKPDNVLIFNLSVSPGVLINAKIADYGISRFAAPYGFSSKEGTPGFRAPEVAKGETYEFQADVYSFGVTLYTLVTGGKHPFHNLTFRSQLDDAVTKPVTLDPITKKNCPPWPDVEDVIDCCLEHVPDHRLTSQQVFEMLNSAELASLQRVVPVSEGQTIECIAIRHFGNDEVEAWVGSGESDGAQLSWFSLSSNHSKPEGIRVAHTRILCMTTVSNSSILVGTQSGQIMVYDSWTHSLRHSVNRQESVLSLQHYASPNLDIVLVGLSNGILLVYESGEIQVSSTCEAVDERRLGSEADPVKCMCIRHGSVYASCGNLISIFSLESLPLIEKCQWSTEEDSVTYPVAIYNMVIGRDLYISKRNTSVMEVWNFERKKQTAKIDISQAVLDIQLKEAEREKSRKASSFSLYSEENIDAVLAQERRASACKITSMMLQNRTTLWIGTRGGFILLIDPIACNILHVLHRHLRAVRALVHVRPLTQKAKSQSTDGITAQVSSDSRLIDPLRLVLTGGGGYQNILGNKQLRSDDYGFITVWDQSLKQQLRNFKELTDKRKELISKNPATATLS